MKILAIDTVSDACSVGILSGKEFFEKTVVTSYQTQVLLPMLQEVLAASRLSFNQIDGLAFSNGPGNFTGVRLVTAFIQGLVLATNLPVWAGSSLLIMAVEGYKQTRIKDLLVIQDAKMGEWYVGYYQYCRGTWRGKDQLLPTEAVWNLIQILPEEILITGNGTIFFSEKRVSLRQDHLSVRTMVELAVEKILRQNDPYRVPLPIYLRGKEAWHK